MFPFDLFYLWLNVSITTLRCHKRIKYKHLNDSHRSRTVEELHFFLLKLFSFVCERTAPYDSGSSPKLQ